MGGWVKMWCEGSREGESPVLCGGAMSGEGVWVSPASSAHVRPACMPLLAAPTCGPCRTLKPILSKVLDEYPGKVNPS